MKLKSRAAIAGVAVIAASGAAVAYASGGDDAGNAPSGRGVHGSRLDDGKSLLPQSKISEKQAIHAAKTAAQGGLNEVDLEHRNGKLVWNVDVGSHDVKVDASSGDVVASDSDD
ncbi:MAG: Peptidase propeptide and domain [Thermoleophilaceae bacterium]|jgi:uncharacterized membrane protein YkoI|nr:Peptidase propeptide and domain [Thermoleophilaceae bacterium]